jgi:uncharacterized protein
MIIANSARPLAQLVEENEPSPAAQPLGRVVSVSGSQVTVQFTSGDDLPDVTIGAFLAIRNGRALVIGALCDISFETSADGRSNASAIGRLDLLGELFCDEAGAGYFERGVMAYPKIGSAVLPVGQRELRIIFDTAGPDTINIGTLQQDGSIGAFVDVDDMVRKHFAIFGSTGAGKSCGVALILRETWRRGRICASC